MLSRWLANLTTTRLKLWRTFGAPTRKAIRAAVARSEREHHAEIRVAVETSLSLRRLLQRTTPRRRAREVFAELDVWDTQQNNGVLIYVLLAEQAVEIVADRGFSGRIDSTEWRTICDELMTAFCADDYATGLEHAVGRIGAISAGFFPLDGDNPNELPDEPHVL